MDINRVVERGIELCHRVAPAELNGQRLRIIPQTHLPPLLGGETNCYGYTSPSLDMHLHHTFKDWDGQRGAGHRARPFEHRARLSHSHRQ